MSRRWFALISGLVLGATFITAASAQDATDGATSADRMSAMRREWAQQTIDPAVKRAAYNTTPAPTQLAQASGNQGRSLFSNWFGRRSNTPSNQQNGKSAQNNQHPNWNVTQQANGAAQGSAKPGATADAGSSSQANSMPPDPADGKTTLPGLGGSPLPRAGAQASRPGTAAKTNGSNQSTTQSQAAQSNTQRQNSSGQAGVRTASRPLDVSSPSSTAANNATSATRHSPNRRSTPHISPDELRRELSGSFPDPAATSDATPHTARAAERANVPSDAPQSEQANDAAAGENQQLISDPAVALPLAEPSNPSADKSAKDAQPAAQPQATVPTEEPTPKSAAEAFGAAQNSRSAFGASNFVRVPLSATHLAGPQTVRGKEAFGEALQVASGGDPSVLASNQTPILTADIRGPKQILVGREAVYRVRLQNQSDVAAEGIVATVRIPTGADVINTTATQGMVQQGQDGQTAGQLQWRLARLERRAGETLEVRIVPRESRPLELGVSWTVAPVGSRAVVEVQEPKLQLEIAGPNEVLFDKPQVFKLTLTNPGTGPAENVKIDLMPPGGGKEAATSHPLGDLAPGAIQTVEVELTAREAGKMFVKAVASAEGGLICDASKEIFCRKAELEVDWRGPTTKYAGTMATYFFRVRNPGTAPAEDVTVRASIPDGAEFTSASEGHMFDAKLREVVWHVGTLAPGDDNYMELKCVVKTPGANQLKVAAATASGDLADSKTVETNVVALADLKLDVTDPSGPVAVGSQAVYEIHVQNRGTNSAKDVNIVALFSDGIEPEQADGAMYTVADGRVSFRAIEELPAGRDVVLRIRAHAVQPGTHVFRAEVLCRDLDIKLAAEETTRFYADDVLPEGQQSEKQAGRSEAFKTNVR